MMPFSTIQRSLTVFCAAILVAMASKALAAPVEAGVSHALAQERAARISKLRYKLAFTLIEHENALAGSETVTFDSKTAGDLAIDYRDGSLTSAALNGQPISTALDNGHLHLPAIAGQNTLTLAFTSNAAAAGKAFTRYQDKDDGGEYLYTLFVPMDASMAFFLLRPAQDLKARFTLEVEHPAGWTVIANTASAASTATHKTFSETSPIRHLSLFRLRRRPLGRHRAVLRTQPSQHSTCANRNWRKPEQRSAPGAADGLARHRLFRRIFRAAFSLP